MKLVVAALIVKDGKILICQRTRHQPMALKWEFPGGKVELNEQPVDALVRELDEELGIRAKIGPQAAVVRHNYGNGAAVELRFYWVEQYESEIENRIFHDIRWVNPGELPSYNFLEADITLVRDLAQGKIWLTGQTPSIPQSGQSGLQQ
jgi:8-oxo-dGTP diphosphatase